MTSLLSNVSSTDPTKFVVGQSACMEDLPEEVLLHIFGSLSLVGLGRTSCVCRRWYDLSSDSMGDFKKFFPYLRVFDEKSWKSYKNLSQLKIEAQSDNRQMTQILQHLFQSLNDKEEITLLTMPKGLSVRMLIENDSSIFRTEELSIKSYIEKEWDAPIIEAYRIAIVENPFKESRDLSCNVFVHRIAYIIPSLLEELAWSIVKNKTHNFKSAIGTIIWSSHSQLGLRNSL